MPHPTPRAQIADKQQGGQSSGNGGNNAGEGGPETTAQAVSTERPRDGVATDPTSWPRRAFLATLGTAGVCTVILRNENGASAATDDTEQELAGTTEQKLAGGAEQKLASGAEQKLASGAEQKLADDLPRERLAGAAAADTPRAGADLGSLYPQVARLASTTEASRSFLSGRYSNWDEYRRPTRERLLELLQYQPEAVEPRADVVDRVDCRDYIRERILFSTTPHFRVPAYLLIPKNRRRPAPAIVDLHSHGGMFVFGKEKVVDLGANHPAMVPYHESNYDGRPTATELARRGFVVISIDAFMFGERRVLLDADRHHGWNRARYSLDDVKQLNARCREKETTLVKALTLAGLTWPGIVFWDDMRTVDYLCQRDEVDSQRIGCLGISMGGYRSMFLAALDERIRAACVVGFMSTVRPMIHAHLDTHSWVHFLPQLHRELDWPDVVALAAPRAVFVQQCEQDKLFPIEGMRDSVRRIAAIYERAGHANQFRGEFYDVPHRFTRAMQNDAFAWLEEQLRA